MYALSSASVNVGSAATVDAVADRGATALAHWTNRLRFFSAAALYAEHLFGKFTAYGQAGGAAGIGQRQFWFCVDDLPDAGEHGGRVFRASVAGDAHGASRARGAARAG